MLACGLHWYPGMATTTKHTHPMVFGRREAGCPRCAELNNGAAPIRWAIRRREDDARERSAQIAAHFAQPNHNCPGGPCYPVCTAFDW